MNNIMNNIMQKALCAKSTLHGASLAKTSALLGLDAAFAVAIATILMMGFPASAYAYVDPSVMTYTIQALAGVAVALSAVLGVAYRRLRKIIVKRFNIDENAGKVVDPHVSRVDATTLDSANAVSAAFWNSAPNPYDAKKLTFKGRLLYSALACFFTGLTLFVLAPIEIIVGNSWSLIYGLSVTWLPVIIAGVVFCIVTTFAVSLIRGRAFDIVISIIVALGVAAWLQTLVMNIGMPSANGSPVHWNELIPQLIISTIVWIAIFVGAIFAARKRTKLFRSVSAIVCSIFIVITIVGTASILNNNNAFSETRDANKIYVTQEGIHTVSPDNNIIVFVLDMYDTTDFIRVQDMYPDMMDEFTGFTWFKNATGSSIPTRYAIPLLLTDSWPEAGEDWDNYQLNRYSSSTFLSDIKSAGYDLGLFTDSMGNPAEWSQAASLTINQHTLPADQEVSIDWVGTITMMAQAALYRDMPWALKSPFWYYTDDMNQAMIPAYVEGTLDSVPYFYNDARYYQSLKREGLSIVDRGTKGSFRFIHLNGAHWPYTMTTSSEKNGTTSYEEQAAGAINIVSEYLKELKRLGVYDSSTIIVTSDHGNWEWDKEDIPIAACPILFVKPAQSAEKDAQPLVTSTVQTGHLDFHATIIEAAAGSTGSYGTTVWEAPENGRTRYFIYPQHDGRIDKQIIKYEITGDCLNLSNWKRSGVTWDYFRPGR